MRHRCVCIYIFMQGHKATKEPDPKGHMRFNIVHPCHLNIEKVGKMIYLATFMVFEQLFI